MKPHVWHVGDSITRDPATGKLYDWKFRPEPQQRQSTSNRTYCVKVLVVGYGDRVFIALATRIHRNTRQFTWREADRKHRMAVLEGGRSGTCVVADEGTAWVRGWRVEDFKILQAASALADT